VKGKFKMIKYDASLALSMQRDKTTIQSFGMPVLVKGIPDESRKGHLDPRELEIIRERSDFFVQSQNKPNKEISIGDIRNMMGFPNLNMNTVEIYTRYEEHIFDGNLVKLWIYYPRKTEGKTGLSAFIYLHGGGWMGGTTFTVENPCRLLAERANCVVFNVDYSLAPEKPYPNGFNDCFNVLRYVYEKAEKYGIDREKIGMGGDSAGGNLTAACALKDRDLGTRMLKYQVLLYPAVTFISKGISGYEWKIDDYEMCDEQIKFIEPGLNLGRPEEGEESVGMRQFYLLHGENARDPYISPLLAVSHQGLCKALIAVAEFDGLRIQGEYYGKKLLDAGVATRIIRYKGVGHAFIDKLGVLPQAEDIVQEMANDILSL
jgi:acetyl esterase